MEKFEEDILKAHSDRVQAIAKAFQSSDNDIQKGKSATVGEIREWGGKKYKKQPNGKWMEVSESHGLTSQEHSFKATKLMEQADKSTDKGRSTKESIKHDEEGQKHASIAGKLSDKEHDESELSGEKEEDEKVTKVVKYLKENKMTTSDRELNDAADIHDYILSPKQKEKVKELFQEKK